MNVALFAGGLVLLYVGAEWLVRGASRLALRLSVPPLIVGLTIVAFGTSAPELLVTTVAAARAQGAISVGNIVGSNIVNLALILGIAAMIRPLRVESALIVREIPMMILATAALVFCALQRRGIDRPAGGVFLAVFVAYLMFVIWQARRAPAAMTAEFKEFEDVRKLGPRFRAAAMDPFLIVAGLAALVLGAQWLVEAAVSFAARAGISQLIIGLTVVAVGTSLPELATSIVAAMHDESDIVLGNVIGSNIFNILLNLGAAATIRPIPIRPEVVSFHLLSLSAVSVLVLPMALTGRTITRAEGAVLIAVYAAYTVLLIVRPG